MAITLPVVDFGSGKGIIVDFVLRYGLASELTPEECNAPRVFYLTDTREFVVSRGDGTHENVTREIKSLRDLVKVLQSRFDVAFSLPEGSTTGDAELADLRVDYRGETHESAGSSVRSQMLDIVDELGAVAQGAYRPIKRVSLTKNLGVLSTVMTSDVMDFVAGESYLLRIKIKGGSLGEGGSLNLTSCKSFNTDEVDNIVDIQNIEKDEYHVIFTASDSAKYLKTSVKAYGEVDVEITVCDAVISRLSALLKEKVDIQGEGQVTPENTTFFTKTIGKNLFPGWINGYRVNLITGELVPDDKSICSKIIHLDAGSDGWKRCYLSGFPDKSLIGTYGSDGKWFTYAETFDGSKNVDYREEMDFVVSVTFSTVEERDAYIARNRAMVANTSADLEDYEPYSPKYLLDPAVIPPLSVAKLIFTGAVEATYDGEKQIVVEIPHSKEPLPARYTAEIEDVKRKILDTAECDAVIFGVIGDLHYNEVSEDNIDMPALDYQMKALRRLCDESIIDFVFCTGDTLSAMDLTLARRILDKTMKFFDGCRTPFLMGKGEYDANRMHTSNLEQEFTVEEWSKRTYPYMRGVQRSTATDYYLSKSQNYYYDLPQRKVRVVHVDTGTYEGLRGYVSTKVLFEWLTTQVFTTELSRDWQFIVVTHSPVDEDYLTAESTNRLHNIRTLCEAITNHSAWYFNTVLGVDSDDPIMNLDFSGWSSVVRMISSGHTHCDRLVVRRGIAISYTGSANPNRVRTDIRNEELFGHIPGATWEVEREVGEMSEALFDIFVVNRDSVNRIRFGEGSDLSVTTETYPISIR